MFFIFFLRLKAFRVGVMSANYGSKRNQDKNGSNKLYFRTCRLVDRGEKKEGYGKFSLSASNAMLDLQCYIIANFSESVIIEGQLFLMLTSILCLYWCIYIFSRGSQAQMYIMDIAGELLCTVSISLDKPLCPHVIFLASSSIFLFWIFVGSYIYLFQILGGQTD